MVSWTRPTRSWKMHAPQKSLVMSLLDEIKYANEDLDEAKKAKGEAEEYRDH